MTQTVKDYIAIPRTTWMKIQWDIPKDKLLEKEKIELGFLSLNELSDSQKENYLDAKKLWDSDFVNL